MDGGTLQTASAEPRVVPRPAEGSYAVPDDDETRGTAHRSPLTYGRRLSARSQRLLTLTLAVVDVLLLLLVVRASGVPVTVSTAPGGVRAAVIAAGIASWLTLLAAFRLYAWEPMSIAERIKRVASAVAVLAAIAFVAGAGRLPFASAPRVDVAVALLLASTVATRLGWSLLLRSLTRRGLIGLRALVIGHSDEPDNLVGMLAADGSDLVPIARVLVDGDPPPSDRLPVLAPLGTLPAAVEALPVECLVVASSRIPGEHLDEIRRLARRRGLRLQVLTRGPGTLSSRLTVRSLGSVVAVSIRPAKLTGVQSVMKRAMDLVGASIVAAVMLPFMAAIAIAVRATSPGPALFRQTRVTKGGRPFTILKFRTMVHDVDREIEQRALDDSTPFFKPQIVDLVTPFGAFLRKTSLDELPQLWNVIRGDMSLVGPRPLPIQQVEANPDLLGPRHEVRAGITGWWQVNGRSDVSAVEAVDKDLFYIENWSLGLDISILFRTIGALIRPRGAY